MSQDEIAEHLRLADEKVLAAKELLRLDLLRDAASRAYYAMYHAAYALVRSKGHAPRTHRGLSMLLGREFHGTDLMPDELFRMFRRAQSIRETGDYDIVFPVDEEGVERLVADAARFVEHARGHLL